MTKTEAARVKVDEYVWCSKLPGVQLRVVEIAPGPPVMLRVPILDWVGYRECQVVGEG